VIVDAEEFAFIKLAAFTDVKWKHLVFHAVISLLKWCGKIIFMRKVFYCSLYWKHMLVWCNAKSCIL